MKYEVEVIKVGALAKDLLENGNLIIFDDTPNEVLGEVCFMHTHGEIDGEIAVGDTVELGPRRYTITAIGDEARKTLRELGHCTFSFHAADTVELPGQIELKGDEDPQPLAVGDKIRIY